MRHHVSPQYIKLTALHNGELLNATLCQYRHVAGKPSRVSHHHPVGSKINRRKGSRRSMEISTEAAFASPHIIVATHCMGFSTLSPHKCNARSIKAFVERMNGPKLP